MAWALAIFGVAFAAAVVWLGVRIVNRHERGAKWTLAATLGLPALYVASFGPVCWLAYRDAISAPTFKAEYPLDGMPSPKFKAVYYPILWIYAHNRGFVSAAIHAYSSLGTGGRFIVNYDETLDLAF